MKASVPSAPMALNPLQEILMLTTLLPKAAHRYLSLPLFGPVMEDFADWLVGQNYTRITCCCHLFPTVVLMDRHLRRRGSHRIQDLSPLDLHRCWKALQRRTTSGASTAHVMERFLKLRGLIRSNDPTPVNTTNLQLTAYAKYLQEVRGLAPSTIHPHLRTARKFLSYVEFDKGPKMLARLDASALEKFVRVASSGISRATLQHTVAQLRSLLHFLAIEGKVRAGLSSQIDSPRLYRLEKLPHSLNWDTVSAFLESIQLTHSKGQRDFAMFFLIAAYGLRSSEVVGLTLDNIFWRSKCIHIAQTKTRSALKLPLTDDVARVLINYLRKVPRAPDHRQLFLRMYAPSGPLKPTAVTEAFQFWAKRSGLSIPFQGAHCLRHSYAVNLLRQGTPLKTIGDLLGHRSAESTSVYLRLATEDLRGVGLPLPVNVQKVGVR